VRGELFQENRREPAEGGHSPLRLWRAAFYFVSLALLLPPLFAHGCHGDDIDHEPLLTPLRNQPEDR
jgi:hypothetical protein